MNNESLEKLKQATKELGLKNMPSIKPLEINSEINKLVASSTADMKRMQDSLEASAREKQRYDQEVLNTLKQIEGNTANLTKLVNLIQASNHNQGEIIELVSELLALAKEKELEVVNSKYREIMNRITTFTNDAQTIATLTGFATMILNILKSGV